jgi:PTS system ascorbate-specific IIC component
MVNFFVKFLSEPTVVLGLVAMIGLIAMKNRPSTVIQGTMKTMLGFLILSAGSS